jgi:putative ABC transport system permease protein
MLRRSPGFTAVAMLCLALGVGANTAIYSVVDAVLLGPWPYPDLDRLVMVYPRSPSSEHNLVSPPEFIDWRDQNHVFERIAAETFVSFNFSDVDQPEQLAGHRVSANYFDLLGVKTALGRTFLPEENCGSAALEPILV